MTFFNCDKNILYIVLNTALPCSHYKGTLMTSTGPLRWHIVIIGYLLFWYFSRDSVVNAPDLKSGNPEIKSHSIKPQAGFVSGSSKFNSCLNITFCQLGFFTWQVYVNSLFHWPWKSPVERAQSITLQVHRLTINENLPLVVN